MIDIGIIPYNDVAALVKPFNSYPAILIMANTCAKEAKASMVKGSGE
jgi:hypothetical protein